MNNTSDTNILAMDIGGTTIKSGSIDVATSLIKTFSVNKTHIHNGLSSIVESIDKAIARHLTSNTVGIAISSAGDIDAYSGKCVYATDNLPDFSGFDIKAYVESKYKLPCQVINDGQGALLGELNFGCAVNLTKVVMLTLGTGVGSAYFDKELGFDKSLELSKIGHYTLVKDGIQCNCGKRGCIEQYISAGALYKLGGARGLTITDCNDIFSLSRADNIIAKEVIDEFVNNLVEAIKLIKQRLDTNVIIFGGGLISTKEFWLPQTQSRVEDVTLLPAKLGNQAGMLGAYVWYNIRQSSK